MEGDGTVHVLWTGGWDSTYRVVELLRRTEARVVPHYIRFDERPSQVNELATMERVREQLAGRDPSYAERVAPLQVSDYTEIPEDQAIDAALAELRATDHLGQQYSWLARYAKATGVGPIELCVEATDGAGRRIGHRIRQVPDSEPANFEVTYGDDAIHVLFQWFRFPLIRRDKESMERDVTRWGMWDLMNGTWFCHKPVLGRYACGTCRPCVYVMNKGQHWRLGRVGHVRFTFIEKPRRMLPEPFKNWLRSRVGPRMKRFIRA